ncbi:MAG: hypothetical protein GXP37_11475 [Chloroflexi bacterium]|nr:hypothetical protein [Chloroflexota bacterium]
MIPKKIFVICTGNICRTPMAKALLVQEIARRGLQDAVKVDSAGVFAVIGAPASQGSVVAMRGPGHQRSSRQAIGKQPCARGGYAAGDGRESAPADLQPLASRS